MKYNKIIRNFALMVVASSTLIACDDFLDREPLDQVSQPTFWKTPEHLDAYIVGKYGWLPGAITDWGMGYFVADITSDNMENRLTHDKWMNGENNTTPTSGGNWKWGPVREINMFFDNYSKCTSPFSAYEQTYGEACFLRALVYHGLVANFGDIPWYSSELNTTDEDMYKARDKRSVVVDSIMNMLDQAVEHLKLRSAVGVNRLNKESALIYKSRVALFEATWAKYHKGTPSASDVDANKYFQKVIDAYEQFKHDCGNFEDYIYTTGNPDKDYYNLFNRFDYSDIKEVTLSKDYNANLGIKNNLNTQVWLYGYYGGAYTRSLIQSYLTKEGQSIDITDEDAVKGKGVAYLNDLAEKLDSRYRQSVFTPGDLLNTVTPPYVDSLFALPQINFSHMGRITTTGWHPKKSHNPEAPIVNQTDPLVDGISFRVAELLLNYAEAYVELHGTYPDLTDNIDLLRKRVGMPTLTSVKPTVEDYWPDYGYPVSDELAIIRQERRVELAGEGYRTNDWKRWRAHKLFEGERPKGFRLCVEDYANEVEKNIPIPVDENGYLDPLKTSLNGGTYHFNADRDYLSPIPTDEILKNPNLTQNPGWDTPKM